MSTQVSLDRLETRPHYGPTRGCIWWTMSRHLPQRCPSSARLYTASSGSVRFPGNSDRRLSSLTLLGATPPVKR